MMVGMMVSALEMVLLVVVVQVKNPYTHMY